jgi:hypothetical protein
MNQFNFRSTDGSDIQPHEWLSMWAELYPSNNYVGYAELIANKSFSAVDFIRIGKWKDAVKTDAKWKANVASVAYPIWLQAALEVPKCPEGSEVETFLLDWSERKYTDAFVMGPVSKRFGLSRATTLLHFLSAGRHPIFDARVRRAMNRLLNSPVQNTVRWYLNSYCPLFAEIAKVCGTGDLRMLDKALFSYGGKHAR